MKTKDFIIAAIAGVILGCALFADTILNQGAIPHV